MTITAAISAICVALIGGAIIDAVRIAPAADVIPEFSLTKRAMVANRSSKPAHARPWAAHCNTFRSTATRACSEAAVRCSKICSFTAALPRRWQLLGQKFEIEQWAGHLLTRNLLRNHRTQGVPHF